MVSAAICLTALIGCLSVSAATRGEGTFTVGSDSGKPGELVTVPIELKYTSGGEGMGIAASLFDVSYNTDALTITDIAAGEDATRDPGSGGLPGGENVPPQDIYTVEYRSNGETISVVDDAVRILAMPAYNETVPADSETVLTSMTVKLTFRIKDGAAAQDYPITVSKEQTCDYGQATPDELGNFTYADDEEFIDMTITNGKITVVEDAPVCTHENLEFVSAVPATEEVNGTITFECADCGEQQVVTVSYYANYRISSTAADYASEISLVFNARNDRLAEQGDYTDAFIYFEHVLASDSSTKITTKNISEAKDTVTGSSSRPSKTWYYGIKSTQLTENVSAYVFVNVNGSWYNGLTTNYSVRTYADARLPLANDTEKKLIVNMLTYGSKMQQFKNYNVENLADANLGEYAQYVTTEDPVIADEKIDNHQETDVYINKYQLDMASKIEAVMYFRSDRYTGENKSDYTVVATWTNANGVELSQTYKTVADGDIKAYTPELQNGEPRENRYTFRFDNLASYDLRQPVTFYIYDGDLEVSHGYTASLEALINSGISSSAWAEEEVAVYKAMLNYCDASYAYFVG